MTEAKNAEAELELARFLAHVKYENGDYVLHDWPIPQSLHDAKTLARALLAAGYRKREDVLREVEG